MIMIRKILFILSILFAFASTMKAQHELTAYSGASSGYTSFPVNTGVFHYYTRSQYVIPASLLTDMSGGKIHALKFYTTSSDDYTTLSDVDVYIKEVSYTSMTTFESKSNCTMIYQGKLHFNPAASGGGGELIIAIATPFQYGGGNLLIGMENTSLTDKSLVKNIAYLCYDNFPDTWPSVYDDYRSSPSALQAQQRKTVPKTTFYYTLGSETFHQPPTSLNMTDIGRTTASISWSAPATANITGYPTAYGYQYKKTSESNWSAETTVTTTSATISGLTPNTSYQFRVRAKYGSDASDYTTAITFVTDCDVQSLPFTEGFEGDLNCWTLVDCNSMTGKSSWTHYTGNYTFQFHFNKTPPQYLISPELATTSAQKTVSFWYKNRSTDQPETFQVGYSTTTSAPSAFTWRSEITASNGQWTPYEDNYPATTKYIAIKYTSNNQYELFIDDFSVLEYDGYLKPANLAMGTIADKSATISWTVPTSGVTGYAYQYKKASDAAWSAETAVTTTSATLSGLSPNTAYNFRVKAKYGGNESTYAYIDFTTECEVMSLPFAEGFENGMGSWTIVNGASLTGIKAAAAHSGSQGFDFIFNTSATQYLIAPEIAGGLAMTVSFWYRNGYQAYPETFQVGYSTTTKDPSAFTWREAVTASNTEWTYFEDDFPAGAKFIAIKLDQTNQSHLYLDDFSFTTLVTNPIARNVAANPLHTSATITWGGASDSYIVKHRIPGERTVFFYDDFEDGTWDDWSHGTYFLDINVPEAGTGVGGGYGFLLHGYGPLYYTRKEYLISPELSGIPEDAKLSFYYRNTDATKKAKFQVGYSTTTKDENAFTLSNQVIVNSNTDWLVYEQTLPANVKYIAIVCLGNLGGTGYLYLDNICIDQTTPAGAWTTIPTTKESLQITGLTPGTQYDFQIVGVKDDVENAGTAITTFTTLTADEPLELALSGDNTPLIEIENGVTCKVKLNGRGLYKDGDWNTLCLPFDVTTTSAPLSGDNVVAMVFDTETSSFNNGTLTLNFTPVTSIPAGTPFIIKWDTNWDIGSPEFSGVTVDKTVRDAVCDLGNGRSITFRGTYKRLSFDDTNTSILFLGAENTLYYPLSGASISAQRAYFQLEGLTAGDPSGSQAAIRSFQLNLEDEATDIVSLPVDSRDQGIDEWYTLDGRKLKGKPTKKGIYIHHHRKVVVK